MPKRKKIIRREKAFRQPAIKSKTAFILLLISEIILFFNAVFLFFWNGWVIETLKGMQNLTLFGKVIEFSVPTSLQLIQTGIVYAFLGLLAIFSYMRIMKEQRLWVWFLLIISFFALMVGRFDAGILMLIATIIYFDKFKKAGR